MSKLLVIKYGLDTRKEGLAVGMTPGIRRRDQWCRPG